LGENAYSAGRILPPPYGVRYSAGMRPPGTEDLGVLRMPERRLRGSASAGKSETENLLDSGNFYV